MGPWGVGFLLLIYPTPVVCVVRVGGDDWKLRPWHYIYVYSNEIWIRIR